MHRLAAFFLAAALTLYVAVIYNSEALLFLFVLELLFLAADLIFFLYQLKMCDIRLRFLLPTAEVNQEIPLEIIVNGGGGVGDVRIDISLQYRRFREEKERMLKVLTRTQVGETKTVFAHIVGLGSGSYQFETAYLRIYDPLSLLFVRKKIHLVQRLDIIPQIYRTEVLVSEPVRHFQGESELYDSIHSGNDSSETFQIRTFQAGDKLKDIHWKLSAKEDTWMVRENGQPLACAVVLLLDLAAERKGRRGDMEKIISLAASISFALVDAKCPHYIAWYAKEEMDMVRVRVDDEEGLYLFLLGILSEDFYSESYDLSHEYRQRFRGEYYLRELRVDLELCLFDGEEMQKKFTPEKLEEELAEFVIRV